MRVTVDASVAVKWFFAEDHREEARHLLAPRIERYAPDLLPVECANVIWKKARRREIASATPFLDRIAKPSEVVRIQPGETLLRDATETALRIGHPVYDSLLHRLRETHGVGARRRLAKVVSAQVPEVSVIALQDGSAMANVEEAGIRLVIDRDRVDGQKRPAGRGAQARACAYPGRYVGVEPQEDGGEPFEDKMTQLVAELREERAEGARLAAAIAENLQALDFGGGE